MPASGLLDVSLTLPMVSMIQVSGIRILEVALWIVFSPENLKSTLSYPCQWLTGCIPNTFCSQYDPGKWDSDFRGDSLG